MALIGCNDPLTAVDVALTNLCSKPPRGYVWTVWWLSCAHENDNELLVNKIVSLVARLCDVLKTVNLPFTGLYEVPLAGVMKVLFNPGFPAQLTILTDCEVPEINSWVLIPTGLAVTTAPVPTEEPTNIENISSLTLVMFVCTPATGSVPFLGYECVVVWLSLEHVKMRELLSKVTRSVVIIPWFEAVNVIIPDTGS